MQYADNACENRDASLDILKSIALFCIFLAHSYPPDVIFQLRNFDVPLLVLVSGILFARSAPKNVPSIIAYIWKKIKRLLFPTWAFLAFFFTTTMLVSRLLHISNSFPLRTIVESFLLLNGIGYVWIIRVFILIALSTPGIIWLENKSPSRSVFFLYLFICYSVYEVLYLLIPKTGLFFADIVIKDGIFYMVPYACIFALGYKVRECSKNNLMFIAGCLFLIYAICFTLINMPYLLGHWNIFFWTEEFKFPPRIYYISYALAVSFLLLSFVDGIRLRGFPSWFVSFVARHSLWLFFWHVGSLIFLRQFLSWGEKNFLLNFMLTVIPPLLIIYVQDSVVENIVQKIKTSSTRKLLLLFLQ
jgi:hypothetical protein